MTQPTDAPDHSPTGPPEQSRVVVVGPDGIAIGELPTRSEGTGEDGNDETSRSVADLVEQPAKVMRLGSMIKQLLEEVRAAPLDEQSRVRLREIHRSTIKELESGLAPELQEELERITLPFGDETIPSEAELRVAQAQLVGWLEGLFHGIQTALFAQQMAARAQFEEIRRRALPPGMGGQQGGPQGGPGQDGAEEARRSGPYL